NLDLRNTTGRWRNAYQFELTQTPIARGDFAFALQDMNFDRRLVINHGRKRQAVAQRNRRVALNNFREQPAARLQAKTERQHVEQHDVFHIASQHATLDSGAHRDNLVRINLSRSFLAKNFRDCAFDNRRARLATNEDHFVDLRSRYLRIGQRAFARLDRLLDQVTNQFFKLVARQRLVQMLRPRGIRRDERQIKSSFTGG